MRGATQDMYLDTRHSRAHLPQVTLPGRPRLLPTRPSLLSADPATDARIQQADAAPTVGPDRYTGHGFLLAPLALVRTTRAFLPP